MVPYWPCDGRDVYISFFRGGGCTEYMRVEEWTEVQRERKRRRAAVLAGKFGNGRTRRMAVGVCKLRKYGNDSIWLDSTEPQAQAVQLYGVPRFN